MNFYPCVYSESKGLFFFYKIRLFDQGGCSGVCPRFIKSKPMIKVYGTAMNKDLFVIPIALKNGIFFCTDSPNNSGKVFLDGHSIQLPMKTFKSIKNFERCYVLMVLSIQHFWIEILYCK